ncbi:variable surface protein [Plasmodium gonderi]|uniref:Variable surface protein n=1 Tax=Plasmodium gonderi TaxID=77519 RepID=A0A1Y1JVV3_PLAGO|nr:variable surface protein [Plasmodium gonderi]GAW84014.1 variable surface protein [Plasmodium gonderi]
MFILLIYILYKKVKTLIPSIINYEKFNGNYFLGYSSDCKDLEKAMHDMDDFQNICMDITGAIDFYNDHIYDDSFDNICTSFKFWMYDYLIKKLGKEENYKKIKHFINTINTIWDRGEKRKNCNILSYVDNVNSVDIMKCAYDYSVDYSTIENQLSITQFKCSNEFSEYIENKILQYKSAKQECVDNTKEYCNELRNLFIAPMNEKLLKLSCKLVSNQVLGSIAQQNFHLTPSEFGKERNQEVHESVDSTQPSKAIMGVTIPVFGILLFFFILYKFSPIGALLHNSLRKKEKTLFNLDDIFDYGLKDYLSEIPSLRNRLNILYPTR